MPFKNSFSGQAGAEEEASEPEGSLRRRGGGHQRGRKGEGGRKEGEEDEER
jgi:hypothetical protein